MYSRRADSHEVRGRSGMNPSSERKTYWSGGPNRYKTIQDNKLDTIIVGHLTNEQINAYQQYLRVEEISDFLRTSQQRRVDILSLLPSGNATESPNLRREPSPPPRYDNNGNRVNTRQIRVQTALEKERSYLIELAASSIKDYQPPYDYKKPEKTLEKLYIPVKDYPDINFVGFLLGPRGNTLRKLQEDSGAKLAIRGKGSVKDGKSMQALPDTFGASDPTRDSFSDELHVVVTADSQQKIAKAIHMTNEVIEKAISSPMHHNELKREQLRELAVLNGTLRETKPFDQQKYSKPNRTGFDITKIVCKICGNIGHFARDCVQRTQNDSNTNYDPNGRGQYQRQGNSMEAIGQESAPYNDTGNNATEEPVPPWKKLKQSESLPPWMSGAPNVPGSSPMNYNANDIKRQAPPPSGPPPPPNPRLNPDSRPPPPTKGKPQPPLRKPPPPSR